MPMPSLNINGRSLAVYLLVLCVTILTGLAGCGPEEAAHSPSQATADRQAIVATRGVEVMPFDLERTAHIFEKLENGGRQQVIADSPDDTPQIALIRSHLAEEGARFQQGDFHDPAMIHGEDMAGLHALMTGAERIRIAYSELPDGAQLLYTTDDAALVTAIHDWFDAQVADHGSHASHQE